MQSQKLTLETRGLVKTFRGRGAVVDHVSLRLEQGEIVGLLGPNGAGKTTTFNMIVGILKPDSGSILLGNQDIARLPLYERARHGLGYLAQDTSIFRKLTVEENIMSILEMSGKSAQEQRDTLARLLDELGVERVAKSKAYMLSGGERRRVEIARALAIEPSFILLDEPFSGVDPKSVEELQTIIYGLCERNLGVLITDHSVRETLSVTDRAYIIHDGKILVEGQAEDLVENQEVRKFYLGDSFYIDTEQHHRQRRRRAESRKEEDREQGRP